MSQKVSAKCKRSLTVWHRTGCGCVSFIIGETYLFDVNEKVELEGLVKYKEYSISRPQEGIVGNPEMRVPFFTRHFAQCYFFDDYFLLIK